MPLCHTSMFQHTILYIHISIGYYVYPCSALLFVELPLCALLLCSMAHFDITMDNDVVRDAHFNITMGTDIARDIHCDVTMSNDIAMCTS